MTTFGVLKGALLGLAVPAIWNKLGNALYDRTAIEELMTKLIGEYRVDEAIT